MNWPSRRQHAGVDQHVPDRAIFAAKAGRVIVQLLPGLEPPEDVADHVLVSVELVNTATDVFLGGVAQKVEFRPVCPEDDPVRPHPMQPHRGVLEKVRQFPLIAPQRLFGLHSLHELANLACDCVNHLQQVGVWLLGALAEEFDDPQGGAGQDDGASEGTMKPFPGCCRDPCKVGLVDDIEDPTRLAGRPEVAR